MKQKKDKEKAKPTKERVYNFKPGISGNPTGMTAKKVKLKPVVDYLKEVLEDRLPDDIIHRLAGNLTAKNPTIFLNSLKLLLSMAPQQRGQLVSPHVMAILEKYWDDFSAGEVIEDVFDSE